MDKYIVNTLKRLLPADIYKYISVSPKRKSDENFYVNIELKDYSNLMYTAFKQSYGDRKSIGAKYKVSVVYDLYADNSTRELETIGYVNNIKEFTVLVYNHFIKFINKKESLVRRITKLENIISSFWK